MQIFVNVFSFEEVFSRRSYKVLKMLRLFAYSPSVSVDLSNQRNYVLSRDVMEFCFSSVAEGLLMVKQKSFHDGCLTDCRVAIKSAPMTRVVFCVRTGVESSVC